MSDGKVIIGVHGLANKPPRETLTDWWRVSLVEGLAHLEGLKHLKEHLKDLQDHLKDPEKHPKAPDPIFDFRMVYWADLLYSHPNHTRKHWTFDMLYNSEPYVPAEEGELQKHDDSWTDSLRARARGAMGDTVDWLKKDLKIDRFADWALGRLLKDLAFYYENKEIENREKPPGLNPTQPLLRNEVAQAVKNAHDEGKEILLIAHSMGSITSYDALRSIGREPGNKVEVAKFATVGSPLGLPHVKHKIIEEWKKRDDFDGDPQVRTPTVVTRDWTNFADRKDPVAADIHLADDYEPNQKGVQVKDDVVLNNYHTYQDGERKDNHHKSYGYLRTPEMAEYVREFLGL